MATYPYTYATIEDVQSRYDSTFIGRLCLDDESRNPDFDRLTMSLEDATGEIDSYLTGGGYTVPLDFVPALLKRMCIDIAIYHTAITSDRMTDQIQLRYDGWIKHLCMIAKRQVALGIAVGQTSTDTAGNTITATAPTEGTGIGSASFARAVRV